MSTLRSLVIIVGLVTGTYAALKPGEKPISLSKIPTPWHVIPLKPKSSSVSLYGDGSIPKEEQESETSTWVIAMNMVYDYGVTPVWEIIMVPINLIIAPITLPFNLVYSMASNAYAAVFGSEESAPENTRNRRDVMSTIGQTVQLPFTFIYSTVLLPFRILRSVMGAVLSPFTSIYGMIFNNGPVDQSTSDISTNSDSSSSSGTGLEQVSSRSQNEEQFDIFDQLRNAAKQYAIDFSVGSWEKIKSDLLPYLDSLIVEYQNSDMIPDNVKDMLQSYHAVYQMAVMLNMM